MEPVGIESCRLSKRLVEDVIRTPSVEHLVQSEPAAFLRSLGASEALAALSWSVRKAAPGERPGLDVETAEVILPTLYFPGEDIPNDDNELCGKLSIVTPCDCSLRSIVKTITDGPAPRTTNDTGPWCTQTPFDCPFNSIEASDCFPRRR